MNTFLPTLINWLQQYGYPALWLSTFIAAIGAPLPISFVLLAAGAFSALGDFNLVLLALIAISASIGGDTVGYFIGRRVGGQLLDKLERQQKFHLISPRTIAHSRVYFIKRGGWAVFLSRFLFPAFGGVINLLAGAEIYPYRRFLPLDVCGEALGALIPLALGYTFGASWDAVGDILTAISGFVTAVLITTYLTVRLVRMLQRMKYVKPVQHTNAFTTYGKEKTESLPP